MPTIKSINSGINVLNKVKIILNHEIALSKVGTMVLSTSTFIILTVLGAYIRIPLPFTPVPVTMQTFFVMLSAVCLGAGLSVISGLSYLLLGFLGLPLFAAGASSGLSVFMGPTGGYLVGFVLCGYVTGRLIRLRDNFSWTVFSISIGALIILLLGVCWLKVSMALTFKRAFMIGFVPFIPGDFLKVMVISYFYKTFKYKFKGF